MPVLPLALLAKLPVAAQAEQLYVPAGFWIGFGVFVLAMLALDLGVFNRDHHAVRFREAAIWSAVWIGLALLFAGGLYFWQLNAADAAAARDITLKFLTGYLVELSLSIDNLFVIALIFAYFHVPDKYQHSVLFWGILGALVMRGALIFAGVGLLTRFHWIIYVFGAFLIFTGVKMLLSHGKKLDPDKNPVIRQFKRFMPVTHELHGGAFFVKLGGLRYATPLFIALLMVEITDLVFAVDSIPAILAITSLPFVVVTSNAFAIMGLRSMYFALAGFIGMFHLLHYGLSAVLIFIGAKMCLIDIYKIPIGVSLAVVVGLIAAAVVASIYIKHPHTGRPHGSHADGTAGDILPEDIELAG
jgi:tellurite resistance protein TerC